MTTSKKKEHIIDYVGENVRVSRNTGVIEPEKILIIRTGAIGDVCHTSNTYRSIKNQYPNAQIHYLTSRLIEPLLSFDPDLNKILIVDPSQLQPFSDEFGAFVKKIKEEKYDLVINLQPSLKTRWLVKRAGIKKQLNYKKNFKMHAVDNFWQTAKKMFTQLEHISSLDLYLNPSIVAEVEAEFVDKKRPIIILNAGGVFAKRQGRTYPLESWIKLGDKIQEKYNATIILTGAKEDEVFLKPLATIKNSIYCVGKYPLEKSVALYKIADLLISGDSGPLHLASALHTKCIGLFGSMPVNRTGVFANGVNVVSKKDCVPCNRRKCKFLKKSKDLYAPCMVDISVEDIFSQVELSLEGTNAK